MFSMVPFLQELEHKCRKWLLCASGVKGMAHKNSWSGEAVKLKNAIVCKALGGGPVSKCFGIVTSDISVALQTTPKKGSVAADQF